jgi:hypothetical protein
MDNYAISNIDNYQSFTENNEELIIKKYIAILNEFFITYNGNDCITKQTNDTNYILTAIDSLSHIFFNLLLYTNNLDLTYHNTQRSLYYYIEFILQISDTEHSFLNLSSHDATIFIYKKTIFEINDDYKKEFIQTPEMIKLFDKLTFIANINKIIIKYSIINYNISDPSCIFDTCYTQIIGHIIHICLSNDNACNILVIIENFINNIYNKQYDYNKFNQLIFHFIKKIIKFDHVEQVNSLINNKFMHSEFDNKSLQLTHSKFITWILS